MDVKPMNAYIVDDESLAIERLERLLSGFDSLHIVGHSSDSAAALAFLSSTDGAFVDVLFLDIQMPGMNGFELLGKLEQQPFVIFTTAFDEYALRAFEVNSIDYLLKPIEREQLDRALAKLGRLHSAERPDWQSDPHLPVLLRELAASLGVRASEYPRRIASRVGERVSFLALDEVTHFFAHDKLTYAVINGRQHSIDQSIAELERRLDPSRFLRIHRSVLVNLECIHELNSLFAGKLVVTLKDPQRTQLPVARDRVRILKTTLAI
jgi:two-component system LytT family response regulator